MLCWAPETGYAAQVLACRQRICQRKTIGQLQKASVESGALSAQGRELIGAEISPEGLEVFTYTDQKGYEIHAQGTIKAEESC